MKSMPEISRQREARVKTKHFQLANGAHFVFGCRRRHSSRHQANCILRRASTRRSLSSRGGYGHFHAQALPMLISFSSENVLIRARKSSSDSSRIPIMGTTILQRAESVANSEEGFPVHSRRTYHGTVARWPDQIRRSGC
jgi:hypothetical protein